MAIGKRVVGVAAAVGTVLAASFFATPAQAGDGVITIAKRLNSPRGLAFAPNGGLYIAEAGRGEPDLASKDQKVMRSASAGLAPSRSSRTASNGGF